MSRQLNVGDIYQPNPENDGKMFLIPNHLKEQVDEELKKIKRENPEISGIQLDDLKQKFLHFIFEYGCMPEYELVPPKGEDRCS